MRGRGKGSFRHACELVSSTHILHFPFFFGTIIGLAIQSGF
jgi:hypothetical protein